MTFDFDQFLRQINLIDIHSILFTCLLCLPKNYTKVTLKNEFLIYKHIYNVPDKNSFPIWHEKCGYADKNTCSVKREKVYYYTTTTTWGTHMYSIHLFDTKKMCFSASIDIITCVMSVWSDLSNIIRPLPYIWWTYPSISHTKNHLMYKSIWKGYLSILYVSLTYMTWRKILSLLHTKSYNCLDRV